MTNLRLLLFGCVIAGVTTSVAVSQPDTPDKKLPFTGPPPPEELQVLASLIGEWNSKLEARPSLQDNEGYARRGK